MKPVVYVDILFLLNFFVNTITIYISLLILKQEIKLWRLVLSAGFLSLYACIMFFPKIQFIYSVFGKAIALIFACFIAYPTKSVLRLLKNTAILFLCNIILGGIVFALIFATNFGTTVGSAVSNGEFYLNINASTLIISIITAYTCVYIVAEIKKENRILSGQIYDIEIIFQDTELSIKGFLDTGCTLCEPISKTPAIIISQRTAKKLFGTVEIWEKYPDKYRLIPYSTIDNKKGFLQGIYPDKITIDGNLIKKSIVAISKENISADDRFDAIFGTEIFEETKSKERTPAL